MLFSSVILLNLLQLIPANDDCRFQNIPQDEKVLKLKDITECEFNFNVNERRRRKIFFLCWEKILNSMDFLTQILGERGVFSIYVAFTSLERWFWIFTEFHLTWQAQSRINSKFLSLFKKSFKTTTLSTEARLRMWSSSHQFIPMRWHSNNIPTLILSVYEYQGSCV